MRRLQNYVRKYGEAAGPALFHAHQSLSAHASVSARLRRKLDILNGKFPAPSRSVAIEPMPLFAHAETLSECPDAAEPVSV